MLKTNKILKILPLKALLLRSKYISDVTFPNFLGNAPSMILFEMSISSKEEDMLKMVEGKGPLNLFDPIYKYCKLLRRPISSGITPARFLHHLQKKKSDLMIKKTKFYQMLKLIRKHAEPRIRTTKRVVAKV